MMTYVVLTASFSPSLRAAWPNFPRAVILWLQLHVFFSYGQTSLRAKEKVGGWQKPTCR